MISRSTTKFLADIYGDLFTTQRTHTQTPYSIDPKRLYDFFFERDYDPWFLSMVEHAFLRYPRNLAEFIMNIHTGESLIAGTSNWTQAQREKLSQKYLTDLAEDIIDFCDSRNFTSQTKENILKLKSKLELDGYGWNSANKKLLFSEEGVLDAKEEQGFLAALVNQLSLENRDITLHHLALSEEQYINRKWDDSISQSRRILESVLREVAMRHSKLTNGTPLPKDKYDSADEVRKYLEKVKLIEQKEREAIAKVYGLLSDTGTHPYIAQQDQARLLRHLALTFSQFVMLRLKGYMSTKK
jgi:hypothetical protein